MCIKTLLAAAVAATFIAGAASAQNYVFQAPVPGLQASQATGGSTAGGDAAPTTPASQCGMVPHMGPAPVGRDAAEYIDPWRAPAVEPGCTAWTVSVVDISAGQERDFTAGAGEGVPEVEAWLPGLPGYQPTDFIEVWYRGVAQ